MVLRNILYLIIAVLLTLLGGCNKLSKEEFERVYRIGVMLPFSGSYASDWDSALDWAVENFNLSVSPGGFRIELVKKDIGAENIKEAAESLINDPTIKAVIGPLTSSDVFEVAPQFIQSKKILMSPVSSAANISRAFAGKNYFWRLSEPDIAQVKTLLLMAQEGGARSVGLITDESQYGASFEDWFGFFATELGLEVAGVEVISSNKTNVCEPAWNRMAASNPHAVITALSLPKHNIELARAFRKNGKQIRLLFSDVACLPALTENLGPLAENLEGTTLSSDPTSGFDISYKVRYGKYPGSFMANMYDAVMLLALALEDSRGMGENELMEALKRIVSGRDGRCSWQRDEMFRARSYIQDGIYPDLIGASGSLNYDELYYTDVSSSTYGHWRVDAGKFVLTEFYTSDGKGRISSTSAAYRIVANKRQIFSENGTCPLVSEKNKTWSCENRINKRKRIFKS